MIKTTIYESDEFGDRRAQVVGDGPIDLGHSGPTVAQRPARMWDTESGVLPAKVNWSALGDVTPDQARVYARAILYAADLADKWTNETQKKED